jgi:Protein of unknown function (DUF4007)
VKKRRRSVERKLTKRRKIVANSVLVEAPILPVSAPRYSFSGHQTFPFRYAWLPKGIRGIEGDPKLFSKPDAMVMLGVGKNMVDSIRFWCGALKLAVIDGRSGTGRSTELGARLFGKRGWDPFLEDPATLWLLHWQLVESPDIASTWFLAFTRWNRDVCTRDELTNWILAVARDSGKKSATPESIRRDIDVFLRTYVPARPDARRPVEDSFDCPLVELGLVKELDDGVYQFNRGSKPTLPVEVFGYALKRYWDAYASDQGTLGFETVLYGPGSPGATFKLSESSLALLLDSLPSWMGFRYDETAGLRVLRRNNSKRSIEAIQFLERYYEKRKQEDAA